MPAHEAFHVPIIALEGIDGAGKTTVFDSLRRDPELEQFRFTGEFQSNIGRILKENLELWQTDPVVKLYAFAADRAFIFQTLAESRSHHAVVWDRYVASAVVYREAERRLGWHGYGLEDAQHINKIFPSPVATILLDVDPEIAARRKGGDVRRAEIVREVYAELAANDSSYVVIDASRPPAEVLSEVKFQILKHAPEANI